jgi:hypothetical protein
MRSNQLSYAPTRGHSKHAHRIRKCRLGSVLRRKVVEGEPADWVPQRRFLPRSGEEMVCSGGRQRVTVAFLWRV